jgi:hypothetical protein
MTKMPRPFGVYGAYKYEGNGGFYERRNIRVITI